MVISQSEQQTAPLKDHVRGEQAQFEGILQRSRGSFLVGKKNGGLIRVSDGLIQGARLHRAVDGSEQRAKREACRAAKMA